MLPLRVKASFVPPPPLKVAVNSCIRGAVRYRQRIIVGSQVDRQNRTGIDMIQID